LRGGGPDNVTVIIADVTDQDIVEQRPIVGGAAARDRGMTSVVDESTPASRASALQAPRPAAPEVPEEEDSERPRRHPVRTAVLLVVLLGLFAAGTWGGWTWTQAQYYVGATPEGDLAVYQGIPGQIAGLHLSRLDHTESTKLADLTKVAQDKVKQGISAGSLTEAEQKYRELVDPANGYTVKPSCSPSPSLSGSTSPSPSPSASPSASTTFPVPAVSVSSSNPTSPSTSPGATPSPSTSPC